MRNGGNRLFRSYIRSIIRRFGFDLVRYDNSNSVNRDELNRDDLTLSIFDSVKNYTTTGSQRVDALVTAVRYIVKNEIVGDIVECGVWKGGSIIAVIETLQALGCNDRDIYLYDTFAGMSTASSVDISYSMEKATEKLADRCTQEYWCVPIEEVKKNVYATGYASEKLHFIKGKVEDTIPEYMPNEISLLRLDTDWYESTKHELIHLFPRLSTNGVLIIDDYGHWQGVKKAVDEYFLDNEIGILLNRIDYAGRIGVKLR